MGNLPILVTDIIRTHPHLRNRAVFATCLVHSPLISRPACRTPTQLEEFSSVGRASVSKTEGRGFESPNSCQAFPR